MGLAPSDAMVGNKVVCAASVVHVREACVCLNVQITVQDINVRRQLRDVVEFTPLAAHQTNQKAYRCGLDGPGWLSGKSKAFIHLCQLSRKPTVDHSRFLHWSWFPFCHASAIIYTWQHYNKKERVYNCFSIHLLDLRCFHECPVFWRTPEVP